MDHEFFIYTHETEKRLFDSRPKNHKSKAYKPCDMTPDDVDYEMSTGKHPEILEICGMNQDSLEHFILNYGKTYRYLHFFHCKLIQDFSPLEELNKLEAVSISGHVKHIREDAFDECSFLGFIFFDGLHAEWAALYDEFINPYVGVICTDGSFYQGGELYE
jgi:hypothetical protein